MSCSAGRAVDYNGGPILRAEDKLMKYVIIITGLAFGLLGLFRRSR